MFRPFSWTQLVGANEGNFGSGRFLLTGFVWEGEVLWEGKGMFRSFLAHLQMTVIGRFAR